MGSIKESGIFMALAIVVLLEGVHLLLIFVAVSKILKLLEQLMPGVEILQKFGDISIRLCIKNWVEVSQLLKNHCLAQ